MIVAPPPPTPAYVIAQSFSDGSATVNDALSRLNGTGPSGNVTGQRPIDTIKIEYFLKNKYLGVVAVVTDITRKPIGQARVVGITKSEKGYQCTLTNKYGQTIPADVVFEGRISDAPTQKRWRMGASSAAGRKRTLEIENHLNSEISAIGSDSLGMASSSLVSPETTPEPVADVLPDGESLNVVDLKTLESSVQNVVIYRGSPYLSSGVPLTVRLEYQL